MTSDYIFLNPPKFFRYAKKFCAGVRVSKLVITR